MQSCGFDRISVVRLMRLPGVTLVRGQTFLQVSNCAGLHSVNEKLQTASPWCMVPDKLS